MSQASPGPDFPWTASQRRGLMLLLTILLFVLAGRLACNHTFIKDPQPDIPARVAELANRLDPNTATWQEIAAIPEVGEKKAKSLMKYRENWIAQHPNSRAFNVPDDLRHVKGIGPATVSNMSPYLMFPETAKNPGKKP